NRPTIALVGYTLHSVLDPALCWGLHANRPCVFNRHRLVLRPWFLIVSPFVVHGLTLARHLTLPPMSFRPKARSYILTYSAAEGSHGGSSASPASGSARQRGRSSNSRSARWMASRRADDE